MGGGAAPYLYFPLSISLHNAQPWRGALLCSPHLDEETGSRVRKLPVATEPAGSLRWRPAPPVSMH